MTEHTIQETLQISQEQWLAFFDQFTKSNRGRSVAIEVADEEMGDEDLFRPSPLASITYDPVTKGNDVVIAIGRDQVAYAHTVNAPKAVWVAKDDSGQVVALDILDHSGTQTILRFSASSSGE